MTGRHRTNILLLCGAAIFGSASWAAGPDGPGPERPTAQAEAATDAVGSIAALADATHLSPLVRVVATEGARHGLGLERSLFPGRGGEAWAVAVRTIQAPARLEAVLRRTIERELHPSDAGAALSFYSTPLGRKVAEREVASRRAMLDAEVEAAALTAAQHAPTDDRTALVVELIETLDLVTANVSGGLNANLAFYRGLADGGALASRLTEREMLAMVWDQEMEIRAATTRWLMAHLTLAYDPLTDDELRDYIAFSGSDAGRGLSAAIFAGFGRVFEETSYELGRAAARFLATEDV